MHPITLDEIPMIVVAKLIKPVSVGSKGTRRGAIHADIGTDIIVDLDCNIGLIEGRHVQLDSSFYQILEN